MSTDGMIFSIAFILMVGLVIWTVSKVLPDLKNKESKLLGVAPVLALTAPTNFSKKTFWQEFSLGLVFIILSTLFLWWQTWTTFLLISNDVNLRTGASMLLLVGIYLIYRSVYRAARKK